MPQSTPQLAPEFLSSILEARWSTVLPRPETHQSDLPKEEHVTDFTNVVARSEGGHVGTFHAAVHPHDEASLREVSTFAGGLLPPRALATYSTSWKLKVAAVSSPSPALCEWEPSAVFFVRMYNVGNLCHLINELLLPLLALALPRPAPREIYTFEVPGDPRVKPLPIFTAIVSQLADRVGNVNQFFASIKQPIKAPSHLQSSPGTAGEPGAAGSSGELLQQSGPGRCLRSVTWGLGIKPMYNAFRVGELRRTIGSMRAMLLGGNQLPPPGASRPTTIFIQRKGSSARHRFIPDLAPLRRQIEIDEMCCDFSKPLAEQLRHISQASVVIGLHGAGLANVMFAREGAILLEFKGWYGLTDYVYRKYVQAIYGGWAVLHIDEPRGKLGHVLTDEHAVVARECLADLQQGGAARCRKLPFVMQASPVGHDWDCWFREWLPSGRLAAKPLLCPTPSWVEAIRLPGHAGHTCWGVHGFGTLEKATGAMTSPRARGEAPSSYRAAFAGGLGQQETLPVASQQPQRRHHNGQRLRLGRAANASQFEALMPSATPSSQGADGANGRQLLAQPSAPGRALRPQEGQAAAFMRLKVGNAGTDAQSPATRYSRQRPFRAAQQRQQQQQQQQQ